MLRKLWKNNLCVNTGDREYSFSYNTLIAAGSREGQRSGGDGYPVETESFWEAGRFIIVGPSETHRPVGISGFKSPLRLDLNRGGTFRPVG